MSIFRTMNMNKIWLKIIIDHLEKMLNAGIIQKRISCLFRY